MDLAIKISYHKKLYLMVLTFIWVITISFIIFFSDILFSDWVSFLIIISISVFASIIAFFDCRRLVDIISRKQKKESTTDVERDFPPRKIAGIILFCMAFITFLFCTMLGGALSGLVFCLPFLVCGIFCFVLKRNVGLWCCWLKICVCGYTTVPKLEDI